MECRCRERKGHRIGQHVAGIGEQRERTRQDAADHLDDHERAGQDQRDRHPSHVAVVVRVTHVPRTLL